MAKKGETWADRYRLDRPLGEGGMGAVWTAQDLRLKRTVALKILAREHVESERARARFEAEALAAASLTSPHIVQIHDFGVHEGSPFIVMERIAGESLHQRLRTHKQFSIEETGGILLQAGRALRVAHRAGIVHRDLKPGNLMIDHSDQERLIKVVDFGVAKVEQDVNQESKSGPLTLPDAVLGTPQYMAPEQARATRDVDSRADLWSMGVIAFRCLTGSLPFKGDSLAAILVAVCTEPHSVASQLRGDLPDGIDVFFGRALAKDPKKRFQTADELVAAFFALAELSAPTGDGAFLTTTLGDLAMARAASASKDEAETVVTGASLEGTGPSVASDWAPDSHRPSKTLDAANLDNRPTRGRRRWPIAVAATIGASVFGFAAVGGIGQGTLSSAAASWGPTTNEISRAIAASPTPVVPAPAPAPAPTATPSASADAASSVKPVVKPAIRRPRPVPVRPAPKPTGGDDIFGERK